MSKTKAELEKEVKELKEQLSDIAEPKESLSSVELLVEASEKIEDRRAKKLVDRAIKRLCNA